MKATNVALLFYTVSVIEAATVTARLGVLISQCAAERTLLFICLQNLHLIATSDVYSRPTALAFCRQVIPRSSLHS